MARVMVIAGGTWQCPIVRLAKSKGHYVICSNLYEDSPAFQYADIGVVANVLDKKKNLEIAREHRPDVVLTEQTDIAVSTVAYLAEELGIKGIGSEIAARFTNKYLMRKFTDEAGFASPRYALCHTKEEAGEFLQKTGRSIMKPLDSQSSRGVHIVDSAEQVNMYFEDCIQYSNSEEAVIMEEYIDGIEFTVDGLKTEDTYYVTAISEKEHYEYNASVAKRLFFSQSNERFDYEELGRINTAMVSAMGLPFGITHAEYKYKDGKFYLIEIAARGGGTRISSDIAPLMSGINSNEIYLEILLGKKVKVIPGKKHECAVLGFFDFKPGKVVKIEGLEKALKLPGVVDIGIEVAVGDDLGQAKDDRSRCGYYLIYGESQKELEDREQKVKNTVKVITE